MDTLFQGYDSRTLPHNTSFSTAFHRPSSRRIRLSNSHDSAGFHPWSDYLATQNRNEQPFIWRREVSSVFGVVDEIGTVTTYPADLTLRYAFKHPTTGIQKVLYVRDPELRWSEIVASVRSDIVPARYVPAVGEEGEKRGPMTEEWFRNMVKQFEVTGGRLLRRGLEVCEQVEDFEWKVYAMLPTVVDDFDLGNFTPETLVECVRDNFHVWHLDSLNRASAILSDFNSGSPTGSCFSFNDGVWDAPPLYPNTLPSASRSVSVAPSYSASFSDVLVPEESMRVDSEDGI
ncbi:hypothetical protein BT96DRAFT_948530 [Gymnopus androsaceus JB14]|uniref:Uncharacterized protein n=1 Tax=Gymnopus androsaceus JB14 TaxID=1447944 RepID=A0A6A4GNQ6_9AGAR|nr:hypothetical protein BT96DRAFT_948530 [Gymnopus androsaceus JB14]